MIGFLTAALVLTAVACVWIFVPLFRSRAGKDAPEHDQTNLQILRDQMAELENDHRAGAIGDAEMAEAKAELERRTLEEVALQKKATTGKDALQKPAMIWGIVGSLAMLGVAGALYSAVGTPSAFDPRVAVAETAGKDPHDFSPAQMEEMLNAFAAKLESEPDNIEGRLMLARSYAQIGKYPQAAAAYEKILARIPDEANVLADYADLVAMMQDGNLAGRPMELVERALKADPTHWKALALAGTYAFEKQDYAQAEAYWTKMKATVPPDSEIARSIDGSIAEARARAGKETNLPAPAAGMPVSDAKIGGTVSLAPEFASKVSPGDTVLIFARLPDGAGTPIVLLRKKAGDLPITFELDDSMAMMPGASLATAGAVKVVARLSKNGVAMAQAGDIEGVSGTVKVGARDVRIVLDTEVK